MIMKKFSIFAICIAVAFMLGAPFASAFDPMASSESMEQSMVFPKVDNSQFNHLTLEEKLDHFFQVPNNLVLCDEYYTYYITRSGRGFFGYVDGLSDCSYGATFVGTVNADLSFTMYLTANCQETCCNLEYFGQIDLQSRTASGTFYQRPGASDCSSSFSFHLGLCGN